ncbi:MAG: Zn-ribbon domain-containing OB-fold protein [Actinomycetota bacterium]|nr:Zn-ribbon domain-containing OB-fold protein [Actinomycetota bacterium]
MGAPEETYFTPVVPMDFTYNYRVGPYITRYLDGFKDKKILGSRCPGCGLVAVPPRKYCGVCNKVMEEMVEVGQEGTLENFTVGHVTIEKGRLAPAEAPYVLGLVKLEEATSALLARVGGIAPSEVRTGMKVKAVWKDEAAGDYDDLDHFEPV